MKVIHQTEIYFAPFMSKVYENVDMSACSPNILEGSRHKRRSTQKTPANNKKSHSW